MEPGKTYHLYTHANGFESLFKSDENFRFFLRRYEHFIPPVADTLAWCLMPNHIHFLIRVKTEEELVSAFSAFGKFETFQKLEARVSKQFANLFSSYTQAFNKMYSRKGSLFIPNFKRKEITHDSYFTRVIHYIHANPVHHGFAKEIGDWPWTSYQDIITARPPGEHNQSVLIKAEEVIQWFGSREQFVLFHRQPVDIKTKQEFDL